MRRVCPGTARRIMAANSSVNATAVGPAPPDAHDSDLPSSGPRASWPWRLSLPSSRNSGRIVHARQTGPGVARERFDHAVRTLVAPRFQALYRASRERREMVGRRLVITPSRTIGGALSGRNTRPCRAVRAAIAAVGTA